MSEGSPAAPVCGAPASNAGTSDALRWISIMRPSATAGAAFGFMIGDACGESRRHQKCLEETNDDLREELDKARAGEEPLCRELKRQRGELNDIHKLVTAVAKTLPKCPS